LSTFGDGLVIPHPGTHAIVSGSLFDRLRPPTHSPLSTHVNDSDHLPHLQRVPERSSETCSTPFEVPTHSTRSTRAIARDYVCVVRGRSTNRLRLPGHSCLTRYSNVSEYLTDRSRLPTIHLRLPICSPQTPDLFVCEYLFGHRALARVHLGLPDHSSRTTRPFIEE
jgi:hypothetical protein